MANLFKLAIECRQCLKPPPKRRMWESPRDYVLRGQTRIGSKVEIFKYEMCVFV